MCCSFTNRCLIILIASNLILIDCDSELLGLHQTLPLKIFNNTFECLFVHLKSFVSFEFHLYSFAELDFGDMTTFGLLNYIERKDVPIDGIDCQVTSWSTHMHE